jgi:hypothetical protein
MRPSLTPEERNELKLLMTAMADGDIAVVMRFAEMFGSKVTAVVRRHLRDLYRNDLAESRDDLACLADDAILVIFDKASGWSPDGGALPWVWADLAIRAAIVKSIGHPTTEFDPQRHDQPASSIGGGRDAGDHYRSLVRSDDRVGLLDSAIGRVGNDRDQAVFRQFNLQQSLGDPSPAHTIAMEFGLSPANVRQIVHRHRRRLQNLARSEPAFTGILDSKWVAA